MSIISFRERIAEKLGIRTATSDSGTLPSLKLFIVADLHSCHFEDMTVIEKALESEYDAVILLGDIFCEDVKNIVTHAKGVPCFYILGNHDKWGQNDGIEGLENLDGKVIETNGVRIAGISGGPKYKEGNFAMRTEEEVEKVFKKIDGCDILVTHESPYHLLSQNRAHSGFQAISRYIAKEKPKLHLFGHHHWRYYGESCGTKEQCIYKCATVNTNPYGVEWVL